MKGPSFWVVVMTELKNRACQEVLSPSSMASRLFRGITAAFRRGRVQTCTCSIGRQCKNLQASQREGWCVILKFCAWKGPEGRPRVDLADLRGCKADSGRPAHAFEEKWAGNMRPRPAGVELWPEVDPFFA